MIRDGPFFLGTCACASIRWVNFMVHHDGIFAMSIYWECICYSTMFIFEFKGTLPRPKMPPSGKSGNKPAFLNGLVVRDHGGFFFHPLIKPLIFPGGEGVGILEGAVPLDSGKVGILPGGEAKKQARNPFWGRQ